MKRTKTKFLDKVALFDGAVGSRLQLNDLVQRNGNERHLAGLAIRQVRVQTPLQEILKNKQTKTRTRHLTKTA
jgi:hypothetical protein